MSVRELLQSSGGQHYERHEGRVDLFYRLDKAGESYSQDATKIITSLLFDILVELRKRDADHTSPTPPPNC